MAVRSLGDAENRLKTVTPRNPTPGAKKVAFVYDYMGRRVRKDVFYYAGGWPADDDPDERWHFVYDGWNVVMVLDGLNSNACVRSYTWGLDLSQSIHGAGGIGGLLAVEETQGTFQGAYWFFYDGNGNVGQVIKAGDQTVAARYEYDPYGNIIGPDPDNDGDWQEHATAFALANPIRFSTKWFDAETGLGYWGIRYYDPQRGRWLSRDPAEEVVGLNLYAFVLNTPLGLYDAVGMQSTQPTSQPSCCQCGDAQRPGNENKWPACCDLVDFLCQNDPEHAGKDCAASKCTCLKGVTEEEPNPCHADDILDRYCRLFPIANCGEGPKAPDPIPAWVFKLCDHPKGKEAFPKCKMYEEKAKSPTTSCVPSCKRYCTKRYPGNTTPQLTKCFNDCEKDCASRPFPNGESPGCCTTTSPTCQPAP